MESGLHHNYLRDYDSETGRYLQEDPLGMFVGFNNYAYAYSSPLIFFDEEGKLVSMLIGAAEGALCAVINDGGVCDAIAGAISGAIGSRPGGTFIAAGIGMAMSAKCNPENCKFNAASAGISSMVGGFASGSDMDSYENLKRSAELSLVDKNKSVEDRFKERAVLKREAMKYKRRAAKVGSIAGCLSGAI